MPNSDKRCCEWPLNFIYGDAVWYRNRPARIAKAWLKNVPPGCAPICFEDTSYYDETVYLPVPVDDLDRRKS